MAGYHFLKVENTQDPAPAARDKPYGAARIEDTNFALLTASLKNQMTASGIPLPEVMELNPPAGWRDPGRTSNTQMTGYATTTRIVGNTDPHAIEAQRVDMLNGLYPAQPSCDTFAISPDQYNAFAALHETAHYVALHDMKNGVNLNSYAFSAANKLSVPVDDSAHLGELRQQNTAAVAGTSGKNASSTQLATDALTIGHIHESIADTGAALYALSNYGDKEGTISLLRNWANMEKATSMPDRGRHDATASINAAIDAYQKNPQAGMSIVDATRWAADIVASQPEIANSAEDRLQNLQSRNMVARGFMHDPGAPYKAAFDGVTGASPEVKAGTQKIIDESTRARNAVCRVGPAAP